MADKTITIDSSGIVYTDRHGLTHTITQNEDFGIGFTDTGDGGHYFGGHSTPNTTIACTDGFRLNVESTSFFNHTANGDLYDTGSIWFKEDDGSKNEWHVRFMTIDDADGIGVNNLDSAILERVDNPMITMTWTDETMA